MGITAIAPPSSQDDEIPAWVIIVPIVIGVLIIIIIVVALYFVSLAITLLHKFYSFLLSWVSLS